jgi:hypothetical protein
VGCTCPTAVIYAGGGDIPDEDLTGVTESGLVFVFNLTPGPVTLLGHIGGTALRSSPIQAFAGETSFGLVFP